MQGTPLYVLRTAQGFEDVYDLGHERGTRAAQEAIERSGNTRYTVGANFPGGTLVTAYTRLSVDEITDVGVALAQSVLSEAQAGTPNYTDSDALFCEAFASGYIVAFVAEQDEYWSNAEGYLQALQQRREQQALDAGLLVESQREDGFPFRSEQEGT